MWIHPPSEPLFDLECVETDRFVRVKLSRALWSLNFKVISAQQLSKFDVIQFSFPTGERFAMIESINWEVKDED